MSRRRIGQETLVSGTAVGGNLHWMSGEAIDWTRVEAQFVDIRHRRRESRPGRRGSIQGAALVCLV